MLLGFTVVFGASSGCELRNPLLLSEAGPTRDDIATVAPDVGEPMDATVAPDVHDASADRHETALADLTHDRRESPAVVDATGDLGRSDAFADGTVDAWEDARADATIDLGEAGRMDAAEVATDLGPGDVPPERCQPACAGRTCGPDGCGGSCGSCPADHACAAGTCACAPSANGACTPACGESCAASVDCRVPSCGCFARCCNDALLGPIWTNSDVECRAAGAAACVGRRSHLFRATRNQRCVYGRATRCPNVCNGATRCGDDRYCGAGCNPGCPPP